jgi:outer membrane protein assembly factor BamA
MRWSLLLFLAAAFSLPGIAQTTASNVPPFYEGQKVASITIAANPHLDVDHYRPLIVQQPDEPFSQQKVNSSVQALKKTNAFADVRVTVMPETAGLRLTFVLEPAYYIGMIKFPGAMKYFSYSRLLQVVNLPDQTVFQQADLETANEALVKFFQGYGFFLAKVHAETQFDDANQLAHITFRVVPGPHAHVGKVDVRGSTPEENRKLEGVMRSFKARFTGALLKRGKPYSPRRIQAATALLKSELSKQHYPDNKIVLGDPQYDPKTNLASVTINVDTGPVIDIRLVGAKLTWIPFQSERR